MYIYIYIYLEIHIYIYIHLHICVVCETWGAGVETEKSCCTIFKQRQNSKIS